jgi:starch synthase (maltosyl-transferring)
LRYRHESDTEWTESFMASLENDQWQGTLTVPAIGSYQYCVQAWIDPFLTWQRDLEKKLAADQDVTTELTIGSELILIASREAAGSDASDLRRFASLIMERGSGTTSGCHLSRDPQLVALMARYAPRHFVAESERELTVLVDRERSNWSAWYEMFPRSCSTTSGKHGTFEDCEKRLGYVADMGFDVLYLPPIHPIGNSHRKGRNGTPVCGPRDVGSPWAIGSPDGGHRAIHPELGTLQEFHNLVKKASQHGMEIALDIAFQCSPDHPWVKEHPEWFRHRPDGTIQYAENPPKKYEDIYPINFECDQWQELWDELRSVFFFWMEQGVRIFRVDNPHTKPYAFWEWVIREVRAADPEVIFLAEAFTRPKVMQQLAKLGFTQSYTYFTWRNTKWDLIEYLTELTQTAMREYFRPNFWPNTPDILNEYLQSGGRPAFLTRLTLAATLGSNYGIYGPAFELCENQPRHPGSEEYLNAEKYEIRFWDINRPDSLRDWVRKINQIRREQPALRNFRSLRFHPVDNDLLVSYTKSVDDLSNIVLVVVNLDPHYTQSGWLELPLDQLGLDPHQAFQVHDLLTDARYLWHGPRNYVQLDPHAFPAHIFVIRRRVHTEQDFDYYM